MQNLHQKLAFPHQIHRLDEAVTYWHCLVLAAGGNVSA